MSLIDPKDLAKIDSQVKVQKGALPMRLQEDNGDENPPDIEKAIAGMRTGEEQQGAAEGSIDVATALMGFWKFVDMMLSMLISRVDAINYKNLSDAELRNISQQTAQVEVFQKLAVAENAPMWLSVANLIGTFGTKFSLSPEFKAKQAAKKASEELAKRNQPNQLTPQQAEILNRIRKDNTISENVQERVEDMYQIADSRKVEPVYDGVPKDESEPVKVVPYELEGEADFDEDDMRLKNQLMAQTEVDEAAYKRMKLAAKKRSMEIRQQEILAKQRVKNGVGILD